MIVSDAGKPFAIDERPTVSGAAILVEAIDILMEQVRGLQFERLELECRHGRRSQAGVVLDR